MDKLLIAAVLTIFAIFFGNFGFEQFSNPQENNSESVVLGMTNKDSGTQEIPIQLDTNDWTKYEDAKSGFGFKYPKSAKVSTSPNQAVTIDYAGDNGMQEENISILMTVEKISENENINTIAEEDIDNMINSQSSIKLLETISPIAVAGNTGITYRIQENENDILFVYIPIRDNNLLKVKNTISISSSNLHKSAEKIIYSLTLIP